MSHSLNNCVNCLPGQKDVDIALKSIGEASKKLLIETVRQNQITSHKQQRSSSRMNLFYSSIFRPDPSCLQVFPGGAE